MHLRPIWLHQVRQVCFLQSGYYGSKSLTLWTKKKDRDIHPARSYRFSGQHAHNRSEVKSNLRRKAKFLVFLFPFSLQRAMLCATLHAATAAMSIWHTFTEYTSAIISCWMLPVDWARKRMLDFTSKIEPGKGDPCKIVEQHMQKAVKRGTHKGTACWSFYFFFIR